MGSGFVGVLGFLSDYSKLAPPPGDNIVDLIWVAPDLRTRLQGYDSFMVDQPEIFLHPESPYWASSRMT